MVKKTLSIAAGLFFTGIFLYMAVRNVDWRELKEILLQVRLGWLPLMLLVGLWSLTLRAVRWRVILFRQPDIPIGLLFRLQSIGLAVNNLLFMRLGELARAALAARQLRLPLATILGTVAVERILDVTVLLLLFSAAAALVPGMVLDSVRGGAGLVLCGLFSGLAMLSAAQVRIRPGGAWHARLGSWPRIQSAAGELAAGGEVLAIPKTALLVWCVSVVIWMSDAGFFWLTARALNLGEVVGYFRAILVLSWAGAGSALPAAPGAIGTFEAMVKMIMVKLGAPASEALAFALFSHAVALIFDTLLGLFFLYRLDLTLTGLQASLEKAGPPPAAGR